MSKNTNIKAVLSNTLPILKITFNATNPLQNPGQHLPRTVATSAPTIHFNTPSKTGRYLLLTIDLDAPFASFPILGPILHYLQPDLTIGVTKDDAGFAVLARSKGETSASVDWVAPRPPPGAGPHRYVFLLYEQPEGFNGKTLGCGGEVGRRQRVRFDIDGFEEKAALGKAVAGNWFTCN